MRLEQISLFVVFLAGASIGRAEKSAPDAERLHLGLAGGTGVAFGGTAGVHAELIYQHVAVSFGVGADLNLGELPCFAVGGRWFHGNREGPFVSGAVAWINVNTPGGTSTGEFDDATDLFVAATLGYRFRHHTGIFFDAGLGAAWVRSRYNGFAPFLGGGPAACTNQSSQAYSCQVTKVLPDVNLALGIEF
jgi:hypothetical protein